MKPYLPAGTGPGADRLLNSEAVQSLFGLSAGVLMSAANGIASLLKTTTANDQAAGTRHSEHETAAAAAVLGANVQNALQLLHDGPRAIASRQVCRTFCEAKRLLIMDSSVRVVTM